MSKNTSRKFLVAYDPAEDSLQLWVDRYIETEILGNRSREVENQIRRQLQRFVDFQVRQRGHDKITTIVNRQVKEWLADLYQDGKGYAPSTVNNHQANLSRFTGWLKFHAPHLLPVDPAKKIKPIGLSAPEPRALNEEQVRSLKSVCDRLERFHQKKGRQWRGVEVPLKAHARPKRDRAIVFTLLSTGLRREELVMLDLDQLQPSDPDQLRQARKARIARVRGKGGTERNVFLSLDARQALADYLEHERPQDVTDSSVAIFLTAAGVPARLPDARMDKRSINRILEQIGRWHDAEQPDPERHLSPLRPHDLRHTFAFMLSKETGGDRFELQRRLGHRSDKYIEIYTNPPEEIAAQWVEKL